MTIFDSRLAAALLVTALAGTPALAAAPVKPVPAKATVAKAVRAKPRAKPSVKAAAPDIVQTPEMLIAAAHAATGRGETELALRMAQSAIVADPTRPASYDALGDVYVAGGMGDFARSYYSEALSIDPTDAAATKAIAALDRGGDTRAAAANTVGADSDGAKPATP